MRLILFLFLIIPFHGINQDTFIKEINANFFGESSIVVTNDNGWLILADEGLQLTKFNECGDIEWSKQYNISNDNCCIGEQITVNSQGLISILSREETHGVFGFRITTLSNTGNFLWSKFYEEQGLNFYPYSLLLNQEEDLLVLANMTPLGGGAAYSTLTKLDPNGAIKWSRKYDDGGSWGSAIVTQDTGTLIRRGDSFIKVDSAGVIDWVTNIVALTSYYYREAVEVSDGYIFTKYRSGSNNIGFYKIDKSGNLLWGGGRYTIFIGLPAPLRKAPNGNFTTILTKDLSSTLATSVIVEFDENLNIVKNNAISLNTSNLYFNDLAYSNSSNIIVVGKSSSPMSQHFIFGKLDENFHSGCDDTASITFTNESAFGTLVPINTSNNNLTTTFIAVTETVVNLLDTLLCSDIKIRTVNLGLDTIICPDTSLILQNLSTDNFSNYLWSTGETSPTISVNSSGKYWVKCSNPCVATNYSDTIDVEVTEISNPNLPTDTILCGDNTILLDAEIPLGQYLWQDKSTAPTFLVIETGNYFVDITYKGCVKRFESNILGCEDFLIPNIFTPNGDGINDYFEVVYLGSKPFECKVYNRWGLLQFETKNAGFQWDGTVGGIAASDGVYLYLITIGDEKLKGTITLVH